MSVTAGELRHNRATVMATWPHTCTTQRREQTGTNPYDEPEYGDWVNHLIKQHCRYWHGRSGGGQRAGERWADNRQIELYQHHLLVPVGTDVTEADIVSQVTNQLGEVIAGNLNIRAVVYGTTGTRLDCEEVR